MVITNKCLTIKHFPAQDGLFCRLLFEKYDDLDDVCRQNGLEANMNRA